jgi:hypothetical protein
MTFSKTTTGPRFQVGSLNHAKSKQMPVINLSHSTILPRRLIPTAFRKNTKTKYSKLQQNMMDIGWRLNRPDDRKEYFTHPTYSEQEYTAYRHSTPSGEVFYFPIVEKSQDPKGLGCSFAMGLKFNTVVTNEWKSIRNTRKGKKKAKYEDYYTARQDKREMYVNMSKTDKSVVVWDKDTPRCSHLTNDMDAKNNSMFDEYYNEYDSDNEQY